MTAQPIYIGVGSHTGTPGLWNVKTAHETVWTFWTVYPPRSSRGFGTWDCIVWYSSKTSS